MLGALSYVLHFLPGGFTFQFRRLVGHCSVVTQAVLVTAIIWLVIQAKSAEIQPFT